MADIRLWNTATRRKEPLEPTVIPGRVGMYVCGPTVYDRAHLGNARPAVVFDTLYRLLRHLYGAQNVTYVRNITDVEDKIIARAAERGVAIDDLTATTAAWYAEDLAALGVLPPDAEPRATAHVPAMVAMIERLVAGGHAYAAEGHVLFAVASYPGYGALSGRSVEDMIAGARVEVAPYKRDPMDFVLWKPSAPHEPGWDSPWGRGRPGWHIECSAMARALLGAEFDIHGGGGDLMFPHHENEIAQSRCAHPEAGFARIWMHNEMLQVDGKKMSKSLGNFFTVRDLLDRGVPGEVIRMVFLGTHYRKPMDWTEEKARAARKRLVRWYRDTDGVDAARTVPSRFTAALCDDLNTHLALSEIDGMSAPQKKASMRMLGLTDAEAVTWFRSVSAEGIMTAARGAQGLHSDRLKPWLERWQSLRDERAYREADALKARLEDTGLKLSVVSGTPTAEILPEFDPARLEALE